MKKILSLFLTIVISFVSLALFNVKTNLLTVKAEDPIEYNLWIGGERVNSDKKE